MRRMLCLGALMTALALSGCGESSGGLSSPNPARVDQESLNSDPKAGPVHVANVNIDGYYMATVKFCDGTTLVYNFVGSKKGGGSVIPESPECGALTVSPSS